MPMGCLFLHHDRMDFPRRTRYSDGIFLYFPFSLEIFSISWQNKSNVNNDYSFERFGDCVAGK